MKQETHKYCICGKTFTGYGNNPAPIKNKGRCCDACNLQVVIYRILGYGNKEAQNGNN